MDRRMGVPTEEIWQRVAKSLESVDMTVYRYHSPNKLSGGQKQRIAIAGIMAMHPSCMVLDEATAMLDPAGRREVLEAVHRLNKEEKVTVILIWMRPWMQIVYSLWIRDKLPWMAHPKRSFPE